MERFVIYDYKFTEINSRLRPIALCRSGEITPKVSIRSSKFHTVIFIVIRMDKLEFIAI